MYHCVSIHRCFAMNNGDFPLPFSMARYQNFVLSALLAQRGSQFWDSWFDRWVGGRNHQTALVGAWISMALSIGTPRPCLQPKPTALRNLSQTHCPACNFGTHRSAPFFLYIPKLYGFRTQFQLNHGYLRLKPSCCIWCLSWQIGPLFRQ